MVTKTPAELEAGNATDTYVESSKTYDVGDLVIFEDNTYLCITPTSGTFNPADWQNQSKAMIGIFTMSYNTHNITLDQFFSVNGGVQIGGADFANRAVPLAIDVKLDKAIVSFSAFNAGADLFVNLYIGDGVGENEVQGNLSIQVMATGTFEDDINSDNVNAGQTIAWRVEGTDSSGVNNFLGSGCRVSHQ